MRYCVYDETGALFRKFDNRETAIKFLQPKWKLVIKAKEKPPQKEIPTTENYGEAKW